MRGLKAREGYSGGEYLQQLLPCLAVMVALVSLPLRSGLPAADLAGAPACNCIVTSETSVLLLNRLTSDFLLV